MTAEVVTLRAKKWECIHFCNIELEVGCEVQCGTSTVLWHFLLLKAHCHAEGHIDTMHESDLNQEPSLLL